MNSFPRGVLVLGAGAVVRSCFLPALKALNLIGRTTIVDPAIAVAEIERTNPGVKAYRSDFRSFLTGPAAQGQYDIAIVALPNSLHEPAVEGALALGLHVLCEKPLALSSEACLRLDHCASSAGRVLAVNMPRRLFPSIEVARTALQQRLIGDLLSLEIEHGGPYAWPAASLAPFEKKNGGVTADMGVHYLDLAEWLAGSLEPVAYSDDSRGGVEADSQYSLRTSDGLPVRLELSRIRQLRNTIELKGSCGCLALQVDNVESCTFTPENGTRSITLSAPDRRISRFEDCFTRQLEEFLRSVSTCSAPQVGASQAARTVALTEWAYRRRHAARIPKPQAGTASSAFRAAPVLVTGATGFIGSHLVERLADLSAEIVALVRSPQTCAQIGRFPVQLQVTNLLDNDQVRSCVRGSRHVFHLAYGRDGNKPSAITTQGTRNVVEAAIAEGCESVVILSSMYVFGRPDGTVTESYPYRPTGGEYGKSKAEMERWCLARARTSGRTRIVVLCPSCVYGPNGKTYSEMPASMARQGVFCWIDQGIGTANITFVENLVDAILLAASNPSAHGERFIINDGWTSWRDFLGPFVAPWQDSVESFTADQLKALNRHAQQHASFLDVCRAILRNPEVMAEARRTAPANFLRAFAGRYAPSLAGYLRRNFAATASNGTPSRPSKLPPPAWLADLFAPSTTRFSAEKARQVLGWTPRVDLAAGQARTVEWLRHMNVHPQTEPAAVYEPTSV